MVAPDDCPSQAAYIGYFADAIAVLQTAAALERTAFELGVDSTAENIDYLEVRWAPRLHLRNGLTVPEVISAVLAGLTAAPLHAVAIVCAMRQDSTEDNVALAREAGCFAGKASSASTLPAMRSATRPRRSGRRSRRREPPASGSRATRGRPGIRPASRRR
jgi:adenosine deaminase